MQNPREMQVRAGHASSFVATMRLLLLLSLYLSLGYAFVRTSIQTSRRQLVKSISKVSEKENQETVNDPRLKEFMAGEGSKEWRGTKTGLERRGELPDPKYSPIDVIRIVLKALQTNDYPQLDHGACVVLEFKSPTGPLAIFSNPAELGAYLRKSYENLVEFKEAKLVGESKVVGSIMQQSVDVIPWESSIPSESYTFYLTQVDNIWLVDAIIKK